MNSDFASVLRRSGLSNDLARRIASEGFNAVSFEMVDAALLKALGFLGVEILAIMNIKTKGLVEQDASNISTDYEPADEEPEESEVDDMLRPYFEPQELKELDAYAKKPYFEQIKRWKEAIDSKDERRAEVMKPPFVIRFEATQKRKAATEEKKKRSIPLDIVECSSPKRISLRPRPAPASPAQESTPHVGKSASITMSSSIPSSSRPLASNVSQGPSTSCSSSSSAPPILNATQAQRASTSSSSALNSLINLNRSRLNQPRATTSKPSITWVLEDIVPQFDVKSVLNKVLADTDRGKKILEQLNENESQLDSADRKLVVRHLTNWLYKVHVSDPKHVTTDLKEELAKSIAVNYSKTFWIPNENNVAPWATLFDRDDNTGFIVNAARPIQKQNQRRKSKTKEADDHVDEQVDDGIDRLALIVPSNRKETKEEILRGMEKYFALRTQERSKGETITFFLTKYIHFTSYGGEIILEEFAKMHPGDENNLPSKFLEVMPKILALPAKRDIDLNLNDNALLSLVLLSQYLPHDIPRKTDKKVKQSWAVEEDLIVVLQTKDNVDDYIIDKRARAQGSVQPYLILIQSDLDQEIVRYFLVLESKAVELSCVNLSSPHATLQAFNVLMKSYVVFNVHHPYGWRNTLHFVQHYMLGVEEVFTSSRGRKSKSSPSQASLWVKLTK